MMDYRIMLPDTSQPREIGSLEEAVVKIAIASDNAMHAEAQDAVRALTLDVDENEARRAAPKETIRDWRRQLRTIQAYVDANARKAGYFETPKPPPARSVEALDDRTLFEMIERSRQFIPKISR